MRPLIFLLAAVLISPSGVLHATGSKDLTRADISSEDRARFAKEEKLALIIGISNYPDGSGLSPLEYADSDARDLGKQFVKLGYRVKVLVNAEATGGVILNQIDSLANLLDKNQGTFLVAFSGHGFAKGEVNYIAPYETDINAVDRTGVKVTEIIARLKNSGAKRRVLLLDACRNDPSGGGKGVGGGQSFVKFKEAEGESILFSTKFGSKSWEYSELKHGVFTHYVLKALQGAAAQAGDMITFRSLADYVGSQVKDYGFERNKIQVPFTGGEAHGDFLLAGGGSIVIDQPAAAPRVAAPSVPPVVPSAPAAQETPKGPTGALSVTTTPSGATVYVNDDAKGVSPLTLSLPIGPARIVARKAGYAEGKETVGIRLDREQKVTLMLDRTSGTVIVESNREGATWSLDGKAMGAVPGRRDDVSVGSHTVRIEKAGYPHAEETVRVEKAGEVRIKGQLYSGGVLELTSNPPGARWYLDGAAMGETPDRVEELAAGEHTLRLERNGLPNWEKSVTVRRGQTTTVDAEMYKTGTLRVEANLPDATWALDGKFMGDLPARQEILVGKYIVSVRLSGLPDQQSEVVVKGNVSNEFSAKFPTARLQVITDIQNAAWSLNGESLSLSGIASRNLVPGRYRVRMDRQGQAAQEREIEIVGGQNATSVWVIGPEMATIPAGCFQMGSPDGMFGSEEGRHKNEKQHKVCIARAFAMSTTEITFNDYDRFAAATGRAKPDDAGWGRGTRPVINVSWEDAQEYTRWLSAQTGKHFRLPSEAEWEYAARAGTKTAYWWGDKIGWNNANCYGCGSQSSERQTTPVKSFKANAFGLYDTAGNVWEWTADCWHENYDLAPNDGSVWLGDCFGRVLRGGSWNDNPARLRSAFRHWSASAYRFGYQGFRLAQDLN